MYLRDKDGTLHLPNKVQLADYSIGIFVYDVEEDITQIEGKCPYVYSDLNDFKDCYSISDIISNLKQEQTVVIRPIEIMDHQ